MIEYNAAPFSLVSNINLYDIMALREEVFALEQKCMAKDFDGLDKDAIHVWAMENNKLIAVARILPPGVYKEGIVSFGRIAIKKNLRGKGHGKSMVKYILNYIKKYYPNVTIKFSAQTYLQKFYESFGFKPVGEIYDEGGISHIAMRD